MGLTRPEPIATALENSGGKAGHYGLGLDIEVAVARGLHRATGLPFWFCRGGRPRITKPWHRRRGWSGLAAVKEGSGVERQHGSKALSNGGGENKLKVSVGRCQRHSGGWSAGSGVVAKLGLVQLRLTPGITRGDRGGCGQCIRCRILLA